MTTDETGGNSQQSRGVSPAISVVLAVAITLVLAATVGAFVLGLGENTSEGPPSLSLSADQQGDRIILTHEAGETINTTNLRLTGVKGWGPSAQEFGAGDRISGTPKPGAERVDIVFETEDSASILRTADVSNIEVSSLVVSDGFERGSELNADSWEQGSNFEDEVERSDEESLSGEYSMKLIDLTTSYGGRDVVSDRIGLEGGETYEFGGSLYLTDSDGNLGDYRYIVRIKWFNESGSEIGDNNKFNDFDSSGFDSEEWNEVNGTATAPSDAATAQLEVSAKENINHDVDTFWDKTFIEPVN